MSNAVADMIVRQPEDLMAVDNGLVELVVTALALSRSRLRKARVQARSVTTAAGRKAL